MSSLRPGAVGGAAAWRRADVADPALWRTALTAAQIDELRRAVAHARSTGRALGDLRAADFPLPTLAREVARWRDEIQSGRGFQMVTGCRCVTGASPTRASASGASACTWAARRAESARRSARPRSRYGEDARDPFVRL
jgi:hypothetical protein